MLKQVGSRMIVLIFEHLHTDFLCLYLLIKCVNGQLSRSIDHNLSFEEEVLAGVLLVLILDLRRCVSETCHFEGFLDVRGVA